MSMDIRALVLVKTIPEILADPTPVSSTAPALLEVAGKSALDRTLERLRHFGLQHITVVSDSDAAAQNANGHGGNYLTAMRERFWRAAENAFNDMVQDGVELVLLVSLGEYAEIDLEGLVQFHLDSQARVSQVCQEGGQLLEVFCISASRRNDAASLFRSQLTKCRVDCPLFLHTGYFNPLKDSRDLRQFAIDILTLKTQTQPSGMQIRPGVWMERGARLEKGARVLAPAFIGAFSKIRAHAVITRCSAIEHHVQVDLGTVIENSTVLPYCRVGAGLDVAHSVVGPGILAHLRRDVTVEIPDPKLIGQAFTAAGQHFLSTALEFAAFLPKQAWYGLFGKPAPQQPDLQTALHQTSPVLGNAAGYQAPACDTSAVTEKFPSNLAVLRRYGHQ